MRWSHVRIFPLVVRRGREAGTLFAGRPRPLERFAEELGPVFRDGRTGPRDPGRRAAGVSSAVRPWAWRTAAAFRRVSGAARPRCADAGRPAPGRASRPDAAQRCRRAIDLSFPADAAARRPGTLAAAGHGHLRPQLAVRQPAAPVAEPEPGQADPFASAPCLPRTPGGGGPGDSRIALRRVPDAGYRPAAGRRQGFLHGLRQSCAAWQRQFAATDPATRRRRPARRGGRALATPWRRRLDAAPADRRGRALPGAGGDARWPPGGIAGAADVAGAARPGARAAGLAIPRGTAGEPGGGPLRTPRAARQFAQAGAVAGDDRRRLVALLGGAGTLRTGAGLARQPGVDRRVSSGAAGTPAGPAATGGRRRTRPAPACQPAQRPGAGPGPLPASAG